MKNNIFDKLSVLWNNKKKDIKELNNIPNDYWMDLNDLDFKKYESSIQKSDSSFFSLSFIFTYFKIMLYGFLFYAICDFMDYEFMKLALIDIGVLILTLTRTIILLFMLFLFCDILDRLILITKKNKHKLTFYRKLKEYKK